MPERRDMIPDEQARDLLSEIPNARVTVVSAARRNRSYERRHRTFTYRLTDKEISDMVGAVAESLFVSVSDVARAFVEVAIDAARQGKIPFEEVPIIKRHLTLYPTGTETWELREEAGWPKELPVRRKKRKLSEVEKRQRQKQLNEYRVSYRWPATVDEQLTRLVENLFGVPTTRSEGRKGWLLTILLRYSLNAYQTGRLTLDPQPSIVKQRLKW